MAPINTLDAQKNSSPIRRPSFSCIQESTPNFHIFYFFLLCAFFFLVQTQAFQLIQHIWSPSFYSPFHRDNANQNWCPKATCQNSPLCEPCRQKFLIVIATGRSGSTTLMNMLDLLPNVRMAGENHGHLIYGLWAAENLEETYEFQYHHTDGVVGAWKHHPIPKQSVACPIQKMIQVLNPPSMEYLMRRANRDGDNKGEGEDLILGFKTVRFHGPDFLSENGDLIPAADFLLEHFPCARFVINIRSDIDKQVKSWQAAFETELDGDEVRHYNRLLVDVASHIGQDRARLVDMSEWIKKDSYGVEVLNELIEWLGFVDCRYESLLHSNVDGYGVDGQAISLGKNCRYQGN